MRDKQNSCWVQEELRRRGMQPLLRLKEDGEFPVEAKKTKMANGTFYKAQNEKEEEEKILIVSHSNHQQDSAALVSLQHQRIQEDDAALAYLHHSKPQEDIHVLVTFVAALKSCTKQRDLHAGIKIHDDIISRGLLQKDVAVGSSLVNMYAKCGALTKAQDVFDEICVRDVVLWNTLMAGYAQRGHGEKALESYEQMQCEGLCPDVITLLCILKACANLRALDKGQELHAQIVGDQLVKNDMVVGTALVDMYAKCGSLSKAQGVFDEIPVRNVVSWNALITGYAQEGQGEDAWNCFERMQVEGFSPTKVTFLSILKACGSMGPTHYKGQEVHGKLVKKGLLNRNVDVGTALIGMYAKCGFLGTAAQVFENLPVRDVVSWNALIAGYAQHDHGEQALDCFKQMKLEGFSPNEVTLSCVLKACGSMGAAEKGQKVHAEIVSEGLSEGTVVSNGLVDMYSKCGLLREAQDVFDECPVQNVVSWNALITGYAQVGHGEEALNCFSQMQLEGPSPDSVTFIGILKACGRVGAAYKGQEVHVQIVRDGVLEKDMVVGTALVDMYANCGMPGEAREVFDQLAVHNVVSWNALMAGYSQLGHDELVFNTFKEMTGEGVEPDLATFAILLNTCSHMGLLYTGQMYFETMITLNNTFPTLEHYSCIVDLFTRAGLFNKAIVAIEEMCFSANLVVWHTVLSGCRKWGNMALGRLAFEYAAESGGTGSAAYVCLSDIYAVASRQVNGDNKQWGDCWWTNASGAMQSLSSGNKEHLHLEHICKAR